MRQVVFVTGGARSGKSRYAQLRAESWGEPLLYIATAQILDDEMGARVEKHRKERGARWDTMEEPLDLVAALKSAEAYEGAMVDCLTLWVTNLMGELGDDTSEFERRTRLFVDALEQYPGRMCIVTNEVGSGIVPANPMARRFRDLAGPFTQLPLSVVEHGSFHHQESAPAEHPHECGASAT